MSKKTSLSKWDVFENSLRYLKEENFPFSEILAILTVFAADKDLVRDYGDRRIFYAIAARVFEVDTSELKLFVEQLNQTLDEITLKGSDGEVIFKDGKLQGDFGKGGEV